MIYELKIHVADLARIQLSVDKAVQKHGLQGIVPTFKHDRNYIGPSFSGGEPVYDPILILSWDDGLKP